MVYLAGAWLILQVADTVIPWLGLDDAVGRILLIVLIVGFVPAVVAAWLFEWTPDGIRFDDEVEVDAAGAVVARRRLDRIITVYVANVYFVNCPSKLMSTCHAGQLDPLSASGHCGPTRSSESECLR